MGYIKTPSHPFIPGNFGSVQNDVAGRAAWFGCLEWTMLEDVYYRYQNGQVFWKHAPVLMHEIGHNLSLYHVFGSDYCNDTNGHSSGFQNASIDNNMMGYNGSQLGITEDQSTRMHHFLHQNQFILQSGQAIEILDGDITQSGNNGVLYTTNNTKSSSATITVQLPNGAPLAWTKVSGFGNFSVNNSGSQITLSNLGSISLKVTWTDNCLDYQSSFTFYNQPFFRITSNADEITMKIGVDEVSDLGTVASDIHIDSPVPPLLIHRVEIFDQAGNQRKTIFLKDTPSTSVHSMNVEDLSPGMYRVVVYTPFQKIEEDVRLE